MLGYNKIHLCTWSSCWYSLLRFTWNPVWPHNRPLKTMSRCPCVNPVSFTWSSTSCWPSFPSGISWQVNLFFYFYIWSSLASCGSFKCPLILPFWFMPHSRGSLSECSPLDSQSNSGHPLNSKSACDSLIHAPWYRLLNFGWTAVTDQYNLLCFVINICSSRTESLVSRPCSAI